MFANYQTCGIHEQCIMKYEMELLLEFIASRVPTSKFELRIQCIHVSNTSNTLP